jgi:hypothetical protein
MIAHDYATDLAIGSNQYFGIVPRYRVISQLAELAHVTKEEYRKLLKDSNHAAFITSEFAVVKEDIGLLHKENWAPVYVIEKLDTRGPDCQHCKYITNWIVNRCLYRDELDERVEKIRKFVKTRIHNNPSNKMDKMWGELFAIIVQGKGIPKEFEEQGTLCIEEIWKLLRAAADQTMTAEELITPVVDLQTILDKVIIDTHQVFYGYILRRGLIGLGSLIFDRTDAAAYERILKAAIEHSLVGKM